MIQPEPMASSEPTTLAECEAVIERGLATFVAVGGALMTIRNRRLYREQGFDRFEDYCRERWSISKTHANRLVDAAEVVTATPIGATGPRNEAQARELVPVLRAEGPEAVADVYRELCAEHGDKVTAAVIRDAVTQRIRCDEAEDEDAPLQREYRDVRDRWVSACREVAAQGGQLTDDDAIGREVRDDLVESCILNVAARELARGGKVPAPPPWWRPASTTARAQANRLAEWQLRVERRAGEWVLWCTAAGLLRNGRWTLPGLQADGQWDRLLTYSVTLGGSTVERMPGKPWDVEGRHLKGLTESQRHDAALGWFAAFIYRPNELAAA